MPKQPEHIISWYPARQCWRRKYQGKTYYLATGGVCNGEQDRKGYLSAFGEWSDIKRRIDSGLPAQRMEPEAAEKVRPPLDINLPRKQLPFASFATWSECPSDEGTPAQPLAVPEGGKTLEPEFVF